MTQQLFTHEINALNLEVANLEQLLASKRQQVESLQLNQSTADSLVNQLGDFVSSLETNVKSTLKEIILELFSNNPNPDPQLDKSHESDTETAQENNQSDSEEEQPSTAIESETATETIPTKANPTEIAETAANSTSSDFTEITSPQSNQSKQTEVSLPQTTETETSETESTETQTSQSQEETAIASADKGVPETKPQALSLAQTKQSGLTVRKITGSNNIYETDRDIAIIGLKNRSLLEAWGKHFRYAMKICSDFNIISGKNCMTNHKHELRLIGINQAHVNELVDSQINFKLTPDRFFAKNHTSHNSNDRSNKSDDSGSINNPTSHSFSAAEKVRLEDLNLGDIVATQRGEYQVLEVPQISIDTDNNSASNRPEEEIKITCKCLKHNVSPDIIGNNYEVPLNLLSLVRKAPQQEDKEISQSIPFTVGQSVKINSERKGKELVGQTGLVTRSSETGFAVQVNENIQFFFANELIAA